MSTADKVAEHAGNACVGAIAMALGDATGGASLVVQSLGGFAVLALARQTDPVRAARTRAADAALAALRANPDFDRANLNRMAYLLQEARFDGITHHTLLAAVNQAEGADIAPPLSGFLFQQLPFDGDDPPTLALTRIVLEAATHACASDAAFREDMRDLMLMTLVRQHKLQDHFLAAMDAKLDRLLELGEATAQNQNVTKELFIGLARRINAKVDDEATAYRELERAVTIAAERAELAALPSNVDDQVSEVLRRLSALNDQNRLDEGADLIAAELARIDAQKARLYDAAIDQDILRRNAPSAARWLVERLKADNPPDLFEALRTLFIEWYTRGRDDGLNFDAEVAIHLAHAAHAHASTPEQRGTALNALGLALDTLGQRETGTARLEEAITAYRAAIEQWTRDRVPLAWVRAQMNLGNTLLALGRLEWGTLRMEDAITAYRAALDVGTRDIVPWDWAMAQMNLGIALQALGNRKHDGAMLEEAVTAIRAALEVRTFDRAPRDWALTQLNLGNALMDLGQELLNLGARERGTKRIQDAVAAFGEALEVFTQDRAPLEWATAHYNLGVAFMKLGELENSTTRLKKAITAFRAALQERRRDRVPLQWAVTVAAQGSATYLLAERTQDAALASEGLHFLKQGVDGLREGGHEVRAETYARTIVFTEALVARLSGNPDRSP